VQWNVSEQYVRAAATSAQTTLLKDFNITISQSWSAPLSHYLPRVACKCPLPNSTKDRLYSIPLAVEERIVNVVRRVRITKLPASTNAMMAWAIHIIKETDYEHNLDEGHASEGWHRGFLRTHDFLIGVERPLEMMRHK
jgi:hypothetical protein